VVAPFNRDVKLSRMSSSTHRVDLAPSAIAVIELRGIDGER
jgi:hypothetical protein